MDTRFIHPALTIFFCTDLIQVNIVSAFVVRIISRKSPRIFSEVTRGNCQTENFKRTVAFMVLYLDQPSSVTMKTTSRVIRCVLNVSQYQGLSDCHIAEIQSSM